MRSGVTAGQTLDSLRGPPLITGLVLRSVSVLVAYITATLLGFLGPSGGASDKEPACQCRT